MEVVKIALVQMNSIIGDINNNLLKINKFVKQASEEKIQVICFPEMAAQGYVINKAGKYAENIPGSISKYISKLSVENNITILCGMCEREVEKYYITQLVCFSNGEIYKYRKIHLGEKEKTIYSPGKDVPVFSSSEIKFGIEICFDTHFPELTSILALKGAEIIFAPHASPTKIENRREIWLKYLPARAYDNSIFFASCNAVGDNGYGKKFYGGTLLIDPKGNILDENFQGEEGMNIKEIDLEKVRNLRSQKHKSMKDKCFLYYRNTELYIKELEKIIL